MTRRDYVEIAGAIKSGYPARPDSATPYSVHAQIAEATAEVMARDNPRFDRARFLKACGVQS